MKTPTGLLIAISLWLVADVASAHLSVTSHETRPFGDQKLGPCEGAPRSDNVYTYAPGETITIEIDEYIAHPGWFRIAFDDDGEDDLLPPSSIDPPEFYVNDAVLMDELDSHDFGGGTRSWQVTLPDVECSNCTLQVIQVMLDKLPYDPQDSGAFSNDLYFRCIDIELVRPDDGTDPGDMDPGDMDPGDMDPGDMDPGDMDPGDMDPTGDPMAGDMDMDPPTAPGPDPAITGGMGAMPPPGNGNAGAGPEQDPQPAPGTNMNTNGINAPVAGQVGTAAPPAAQPTANGGESGSGCSVATRQSRSTIPLAAALVALVVGILARRRTRIRRAG